MLLLLQPTREIAQPFVGIAPTQIIIPEKSIAMEFELLENNAVCQ